MCVRIFKMSKGMHNLKNYQVYKQKFKISGLENSDN